MASISDDYDSDYRKAKEMRFPHAATLKAAQGGVTEAIVEEVELLRVQVYDLREANADLRERSAALEAALSAQQGEVVEWRFKLDDGSFQHGTAGHEVRIPRPIVEATPLYTAPPAQPAERVPDGWKLAMFVLQSDLFAKLPEEERAVCEALIAENPYINLPASPAPSPARGDVGEIPDECPAGCNGGYFVETTTGAADECQVCGGTGIDESKDTRP